MNGYNSYSDENSGIYLRMMTASDSPRIIAWRNQEDVRKNFIYQEPFTIEGHENWIRTMIDTGKAIQMMICDLKTNMPLGSVYIRDIDRTHRKAEYGIFIGEGGSRGRGIGTAAARLMIRYSFREEGLHKLMLRVYADNQQAIRSYEKAGFVKEAYLKDDVWIDGRFRDMILMGVCNE